MNASATTGTIQPVVRRVASSSSTMKMTPRTMSSCVGDGGAVGEILAALDGVDQDGGAGDARHHVPPADAVAKARRHRKQQEAQHQHEGDVGVAQRLRRDDRKIAERPGAGDRRIEVEQRHRHRDRGRRAAGQAGQPVDRALLGLDEFLGLASAPRRKCPADPPPGRYGPLRHRPPALAALPASCRSSPRRKLAWGHGSRYSTNVSECRQLRAGQRALQRARIAARRGPPGLAPRPSAVPRLISHSFDIGERRARPVFNELPERLLAGQTSIDILQLGPASPRIPRVLLEDMAPRSWRASHRSANRPWRTSRRSRSD